MRMWMVDPAIMCRKHLLGEHVELHMFIGTLNRGVSVQGYLDNNLMEPARLHQRHHSLVTEMTRRKYKHKSPLPKSTVRLSRKVLKKKVDAGASLKELLRRCPECALRHSKLMAT